MRRGKALVTRDQAVSAFSGALMRLCDATSALGAALVDAEGETVDYAGCLEPFEIRVAAAEWRLVLQCANGGNTLGAVSRLLFRGGSKSYAVYGIADGYALVLQIPRRSFMPSIRAVSEAVRLLAMEAGLAVDEGSELFQERWYRVEVRFDSVRRRPTDIWLSGGWLPLEIFGRYSESERGARCVGYRARLADGAELTLVRESLDRWYADELPAAPSSHRPSPPK
jgi:hypothetical protein